MQLPFPTPALPGRADLTSCLPRAAGVTAMNSQLTDGAIPVGHNKGVSVTEGTQISHSSPKKVRKRLALECIGCLLTAATVSSSTSHS